LNCSDGAAIGTWGIANSGIQTFGGTSDDYGYGIATNGTSVYLTGQFQSADAKMGGAGTAISSAGSADAYVLALNCSNGLAKASWGLSGSGIQTFGGTYDEYGIGIAISGNDDAVFVTGFYASFGSRIGGAGAAVSPPGGYDAFAIKLNRSNGSAGAGFGKLSSGIQTFGGTGDDFNYGGVAVFDKTLILAGNFNSVNAGVGGTGTVDSTGFGSFLLTLNTTDGSATPIITSSLAVGSVNGPTSMLVLTATNGPPANSTDPTVSGTLLVGQQLTTTTGTWIDPDDDALTFTYQWRRADDASGTNAANIGGATTNNYTLGTADAHKFVSLTVTANDNNGGVAPVSTAWAAVNNTEPTNPVAPAVSGAFLVGQQLSTTIGTWTDADLDALTYSIQWKRADDASGTNAANIGGASANGYILTAADAHKFVCVSVTADDGHGGVTPISTTWTAVNNTAPANSVAPAVSGTYLIGQQLTTTTGTWADADGDALTFSCQWKRADDASGTNAANIGGASANSYTLTTADAHKFVGVTVTADDGHSGATPYSTAWTALNNTAPTNIFAPAASGTYLVGQQLTTTTGNWSDVDGDALTFSYQWRRADDASGTNAANIGGASANGYTLTTADAHIFVCVTVTADDGHVGVTPISTTWTAVNNTAPANTVAPTFSGVYLVGQQLTTTNGTWTDADGDTLSFSCQWKRADDASGTNAANIGGASANSYTLTTADAHNFVCASVTADDGHGGTAPVATAWTAVIDNAPVISSTPTASPNPAMVAQVVAFMAAATDADNDALTYMWDFGDGANGAGASASHAYAAFGTYTAILSVSDGLNATATTISVEVLASGSGPDSDGDGFSDSFEISANTDPNDPHDSPTGCAVPGVADLAVWKLMIKLNFAKGGNDSIFFSGTLPIPAGFHVGNQNVTFDVGGAIKGIKLDAKGRSTVFKLSVKSKNGIVPAQTAKYSVKLSKDDFAAELADDDFVNANVASAPVRIIVRVILGGIIYQHAVSAVYTAKEKKSGHASRP
jgi:hypothetical protein